MVRLKSGVAWQLVDDEVVVLDLASSAYLGVNEAGAALWPLVASGAAEADLAQVLSARFGIGVDQAGADAAAFVSRLRSLALVEEP